MKKFLAIILFNVVLVLVFFGGLVSGIRLTFDYVARTMAPVSLKQKQPPTGYEVLAEMNAYRRKNGLPNLVLYQPLCNNISERWTNYRTTNSHDGLRDFHKKYMPEIDNLVEILATGATAQDIVNNWASSPSHDLYMKTNLKVCVYSADGSAVALLSR